MVQNKANGARHQDDKGSLLAYETLFPNLAGANDFVLRGGQLGQSEGAAAVEFLGADAHLGTETEFAAVGEAGGSIPVDRGGIDFTEELASVLRVAGDNGV